MTMVAIGDVLAGKYRVDKVLGIGGMGMVVAAMHLELDQKVALKFMLPDAMRSPTAVERFLREAKNAVKLRSEHICRVLDVGKLDTGAPYIVMEFMEGFDFAHVVQTGKLTVADAVDHVMQAMEGLAEAHVQGIVHRDLKPANMFVTTDNEGSAMVKVLDFGISKSQGGATKTGDIMGSPAYMAPEQMASSKNVDARADIWALGVILYQAITGVLPFEGDTLPALCMSVLNSTPPSPAQVRAGLPAALADVVMRCLEKAPDKRYATVSELANALAEFGTPEAAMGAKRIAKVLRRTSVGSGAAAVPTPAPGSLAPPSPGVAPTVASTLPPISSSAGLEPTVLPSSLQPTVPPSASSPDLVAAPASPGVRTTLSSSAVEMAPRSEPPKKSKLALIAGGVTVAVAAVILVVVMKSGGDDKSATTNATTSTQPPPQPPPSEPAAKSSPAPTPVDVAKEPAPSEPTPAPVPVEVAKPTTKPAVASKPTTKPVTKPSEIKTTKLDTKPATTTATKPVEVAKPVEPKPTETTKAAEPKPVEVAKPVEPKPAETKPAETKPTSKWTKMQHDKKQ